MLADSHYDIAIVGGGAAGVAATSAAAQSPLRIALIESTDHLGGAVSAAMHRSLCGLYAAEPKSPLDTLNLGPQRSIVAAMLAGAPNAVRAKQLGKTWVLEFPAAAWQAALQQAVAAPNIDRLMNTRVIAVTRHGSRLTSIHLDGEKPATITARLFIDCTGGGSLLQLVGDHAMLPPDPDRMLGGYAIRLANLPGDTDSLRLQIPYALAQAVAVNALPPHARFTTFHPGPHAGEGVLKLAIPPAQMNDSAASSFARAVIAHLKIAIPDFSSAQIVEMSAHPVARDGRRLQGRYVMTERDILHPHQHQDAAVRAWWPIERWDSVTGPSYTYPPQGQPYGIPSDALRSATIENLLAAGLCVSATPPAAASIRASGICLATGALAGQFAASLLMPGNRI